MSLDYQQIKADNQKAGKPFLIDWTPALTLDIHFDSVKLSGNWVKTPHLKAAFWAQTPLRHMRCGQYLYFNLL